MDSATLARALIESAWLTARLAAGLAFAGFAVAVVAFRLRSGAGGRPAITHRRAGAGSRVAAMALAFAAGIAVTVWTRDQATAWLPAAGQAIAAATATLAVLAGGMMAIWAGSALGVNFALDAAAREGGGLVTGGPFTLVRHPFYAAVGLLGAGAALAFGCLAGAAVFLALYAPAARWRAALEEEVLAEAWPAAWTEYAAKTPRFIPRW